MDQYNRNSSDIFTKNCPVGLFSKHIQAFCGKIGVLPGEGVGRKDREMYCVASLETLDFANGYDAVDQWTNQGLQIDEILLDREFDHHTSPTKIRDDRAMESVPFCDPTIPANQMQFSAHDDQKNGTNWFNISQSGADPIADLGKMKVR